ncbi:hypothetical protein CEXT_439611 [Caerostris extrusa]|uniref:Uncharacterized protein n=1 Tax=Caerostris extrusa TaxID=172846 RepID=A0AAV4T3N4_CAEEX|nr:hypothetical protein CEXT_439611 [Caerostris extrusa]
MLYIALKRQESNFSERLPKPSSAASHPPTTPADDFHPAAPQHPRKQDSFPPPSSQVLLLIEVNACVQQGEAWNVMEIPCTESRFAVHTPSGEGGIHQSRLVLPTKRLPKRTSPA